MAIFDKFARSKQKTIRNRGQGFCKQNFKAYLKGSTLHGLRFIDDGTITIWERGFFLLAVIAALAVTGNLTFYFFAKWRSTQIIIGINPSPTSISEIPFPTITICNMNQLLKSKVSNHKRDSAEAALIDMACFSKEDYSSNSTELPANYKSNNLSLAEFFWKNGQSCKTMLRSCNLDSEIQNCSHLFRDMLADEGLCCVFNTLHSSFRFKNYKLDRNRVHDPKKAIPIDWSPEMGYPKDLPKNYYPRQGKGIGVSMGLTLVLNVEYDEYYCSSTNGVGFKLALNSPIETPRVKENGYIVGVGIETRFSIDAHNYVAQPKLRRLPASTRNCLFGDEGNLKFYKHYTRLNCENECQSRYVYQKCGCIPFNLPTIYSNASACGSSQYFCVIKSENSWLRSDDSPCRLRCLNSCYDYTYTVSSYSAPLVQGNYWIQNDGNLQNVSRKYIRENIVVLHFFFREFVFHGNTRNVFIGLTEFLSDVGGIMSLFLGFSFISLAEIFYFIAMRPFFWWLKRRRQVGIAGEDLSEGKVSDRATWLGEETLRNRQTQAWMEPTLWNRWNYRKYKNDILKYHMTNFSEPERVVKFNEKLFQ